jgi:hypothetical protein
MIVWRRERRDLKFMALSIGRIYSGAVALDWRQRLSRFRSSATPPTCVRVRDRPTLSNARSHLKTPRGQSGRKRARQAGFAYAPARLFRTHSAGAAPQAIPFNPLKPFWSRRIRRSRGAASPAGGSSRPSPSHHHTIAQILRKWLRHSPLASAKPTG